jgi:hypothetical protein
MPDPRQAPTYDGVVVGDVAFWILVEIARVDFTAMLPEDVAERFKERGVYAYFEYVALPFNRAELQQRWRSWWRTSSKR